MGLLLLWKGIQCYTSAVFTPFDPSTCVIIDKGNGVMVDNWTL